jgi:hypothetical protein
MTTSSGSPVQSALAPIAENRSWRSGLTVTVPWWLLMLGTLFLKEMRPYTGVSVVLTILLAVLWFTNDHVSRIGLVSRVVQL